MNKNSLFKSTIKTPTKNEKSDFIGDISAYMSEVEKIISNLSISKKNKLKLLENIEKLFIETNNLIENFEIEKEEIKKTIKEILLSKQIEQNTTIDTQKAKLEEVLKNLDKQRIYQEGLKKQKEDIIKDIEIIDTNHDFYLDEKDTLLHAQQLSYLKENNSTETLDDLLIKPEGIDDLVKSYQNLEIPKDLLDKIIFLKGENNTGKHSVIKAIGNELNRPVFRIKYEDYMDENGLYGIFFVLTNHLRKQRSIKNDLIAEYNDLLAKYDTIKKTQYDKNTTSQIEDLDGNIISFDLGKQSEKKAFLENFKYTIDEIKTEIEITEDSCILYIDDLDEIMQSTKLDKGELLGPVKAVIDNIKNEDHDVLLILVGNNLGQNNDNFKHKIDRIFDFNKVKYNHQEVFNKIISNYCLKNNIPNIFIDLKLNNLPEEYQDIKSLDKIAKAIIRIGIGEENKITQEVLNKEIEKFVNLKKSLSNGIGLR